MNWGEGELTGPATNDQSSTLQQITVTGYIIPRIGEGPQPSQLWIKILLALHGRKFRTAHHQR
jgi:hypothetical protein